MWRFLLALLVLISAAGGAWLLINDPISAAQSAAPAGSAPTPDEPERSLPREALDPLSETAARAARTEATQTPAPLAPEPQGIEDGAAPPQPDGDLSAKFQGLGDDELADRLRTVERAVEAALAREWSTRLDSGRYELHVLPVDDARSTSELIAEFGGDDPLCSVRPNFEPTSNAAAGRVSSVSVVRLRREEAPELAAQVDERTWLRARLGRTER